MWQIQGMSEKSDEYERLVENLVADLVPRAGVTTERIERDVQVAGRSTSNQIDVLWDLTDANGQPTRIVFEAKSHKRPIDQGRLHAFRSVVDDIQDDGRPVSGVMVTTVGYQKGARSVTSTYGLVVLELRAPTAADMAGRVESVHVTIVAQALVVRDVRFDAIEVYDEAAAGLVEIGQVELEGPAGRVPLDRHLLDGEIGTLGAPRPPHTIRRVFDPPADLWVGGVRAATVQAVEAVVGDEMAPPATFVVGGLRDVAWMIRNALTGARAWIAEDGRIWRTPD